jgi:hypothetical protein
MIINGNIEINDINKNYEAIKKGILKLLMTSLMILKF